MAANEEKPETKDAKQQKKPENTSNYASILLFIYSVNSASIS